MTAVREVCGNSAKRFGIDRDSPDVGPGQGVPLDGNRFLTIYSRRIDGRGSLEYTR